MSRLLEVVRQIAPHCNDNYLRGIEDAESKEFERAGIVTPLRQAHFLGQFLGETGGGVVLRESGAYKSVDRLMQIFGAGRHSAGIQTAEAGRIIALPMPKREMVLFERVYGAGNPYKMNELGNRPGDGYPMRGIGPIQCTGRGAIKRWGDKLGVDFVTDPEVMLDPKWIFDPAIFEWSAGNCNALADVNDDRRIRRYINGGYNGYEDCVEWREKAWAILRRPADPAESWQAGNPDTFIKSVQNQLNLLGYEPKLVEDGRTGPKTRAAIKWFQQIAGLRADGVAGPLTHAALQLRFTTKRAA